MNYFANTMIGAGLCRPQALWRLSHVLMAVLWLGWGLEAQIYVKHDATGANNGTSWANAYTNLHLALGSATAGAQVWVAAGTYKPTGYPAGCTEGCVTTRDYAFGIPDGVSLYGGFAGTETSPEQRDLYFNPTPSILSGDIGVVGDSTDNCFHVLIAAAPITGGLGVRVDGFTITEGHANGGGYAITMNGNVILHDAGGGVYLENGDNHLHSNNIHHNRASYGGGLFVSHQYVPDGVDTLTSNDIHHNIALSSAGAGMHTQFGGEHYLNGNVFVGNIANGNGGGLFLTYTAAAVHHNGFSGNTGVDGAGVYVNASDLSFVGNVVRDNSALVGGGLSVYACEGDIANNKFADNSAASNGGGLMVYFGDGIRVENNLLMGNIAAIGGGAYIHEGASLYNNTFYGNSCSEFYDGGALYLYFDTTVVRNNIFWANAKGGNAAVSGADIFNSGSILSLSHCLTQQNSSFASGVGIINNQDPLFVAPELENYLLLPGSPCIDAGSAAGAPTYDYYFWPRPEGLGVDLGAIESLAAGNRHYVKHDATGANDGTSWANAYTDLQVAINAALAGDQIWVAAGTYKPSQKPTGVVSGDDRHRAFFLNKNIQIYGGFAGTESTLEQRNLISTPASILSGDIGAAGNDADNCYHVFITKGLSPAATIDGLTIAHGHANGDYYSNIEYEGAYLLSSYGGGLYNHASSPTLANMNVWSNRATGGAGLYNVSYASPILIVVAVTDNIASFEGGGMYNFGQSSPVLSSVAISGNTSGGNGGGLYNYAYASPTFNYVNISGNTAGGYGGGLYNEFASLTLTNTTISDNTAGAAGGGLYNENTSSATLTNVKITGNTAVTHGGGVYNGIAFCTLTNATISGNTAGTNGGGLYNAGYYAPTISNSILWANGSSGVFNDINLDGPTQTAIFQHSIVQASGGSAAWVSSYGTDGGGNLDADPLFVGPSDFSLQAASPAIDAGLSAYNSMAIDLVGNARIQGAAIDMGAYERAPDEPFVCLPPAGAPLIVPQSPSSVYIDWADAEGALTYPFLWRQIGPGVPFTRVNVQKSAYTLTGLNPGTNHAIRLRSKCGPTPADMSALSPTYTFTTPTGSGTCGTPSIAVIDSVAANRVRVYWPYVPGATEYRLQFRPVGTSVWASRTSTEANVFVNGITAGIEYEYRVNATCPAGITDYSAIFTYTLNDGSTARPIGAEGPAAAPASLYPNPVRDWLTLEHAEGAEAAILNSMGQGLWQGQVNDAQQRIEVGHLPAGLYVLHIRREGAAPQVLRFVKE